LLDFPKALEAGAAERKTPAGKRRAENGYMLRLLYHLQK
jgi:hypothetical protein